jgi:hypothetical protein
MWKVFTRPTCVSDFWSMKESREFKKYKNKHVMFIKISKTNPKKVEETVFLQNFKATFKIFSGG